MRELPIYPKPRTSTVLDETIVQRSQFASTIYRVNQACPKKDEDAFEFSI
jgi:hypothetical protein